MKRLLPWVLVFMLSSFSVVIIWVTFGRIIPRQGRRIAGYGAALSSIALDLHRRDFVENSQVLHLLAAEANILERETSPVPGVMLHRISLDNNTYNPQGYIVAMQQLICAYNLFTLGQVCHLAMEGEDSPRVRYVLKTAKDLYQGSYESKLLTRLSALKEGDDEAQILFAKVYEDQASGRAGLTKQYFSSTIMSSTGEWVVFPSDMPESTSSTDERQVR